MFRARSLRRVARSGPGTAGAVLLLLLLTAALAAGCSAPISTIRSPAHPRVIEVRNTTDEMRLIEIEPAAFQDLGASTTFTGRLRPGETKILYLYDGYTYHFRLVDVSGERDDVRQDFRVASDMLIAYAGDSLVTERDPTVEVGEPVLVGSPAYEGVSEARLDRLVKQLDVFLSRAALAEYAGLDEAGKREFLLRFWAARDPTPGTPENEFRVQVEERLAAVEGRFRTVGETGTATPRGRIYLKYGKPDRLVERTLTTELGKPYEIWEYFTTGYTYVFLDELRSGRFVLLTSSDPNEPGFPNWSERLPPEAAEEILEPLAGAALRDTRGAASTLDRRGAQSDPLAAPSPLRLPLAAPSELRAPVTRPVGNRPGMPCVLPVCVLPAAGRAAEFLLPA